MKKRLLCIVLLLSTLLSTTLHPTKALATGKTGFDPLAYRSPDISAMAGRDIVNVIDKEMYKLYQKDYPVPCNFYRRHDGTWGKIRYKWLEYSVKYYQQRYSLPLLRSPVVYDLCDPSWPPDKVPYIDYSIGSMSISTRSAYIPARSGPRSTKTRTARQRSTKNWWRRLWDPSATPPACST